MLAPSNSEQVRRLVENVLSVSHEVNPGYIHTEHMAWALGILADVVLQKNYMDNIVFARLHERLNLLTNSRKFPTRF